MKVAAGELPLEKLGDGAVTVLEQEQALFEFLETGEAVGRQGLSLEDREVDFDLG